MPAPLPGPRRTGKRPPIHRARWDCRADPRRWCAGLSGSNARSADHAHRSMCPGYRSPSDRQPASISGAAPAAARRADAPAPSRPGSASSRSSPILSGAWQVLDRTHVFNSRNGLACGINPQPSNVYLMSTNASAENIQEQIVALLPRLRRFARNLARNPHDADDVVQIAVERALTRLDQWRSDARLDSWMFKIVRNVWIDELRSRGRRDKVFLASEAGENVGTDSMARETDLLAVQSAMARLPQEQREAVGLVLVEGLPYRETADVLDVPIGTLTSRLARGREALQAMLGMEGEDS